MSSRGPIMARADTTKQTTAHGGNALKAKVLVGGNHAEAVEVCHLVCHAFAHARVLLAVATRRQAGGLHRALEGRHGERVGLAVSDVHRRGPRLLVATFGNIPSDTYGTWDVVLLLYGEQ